MTIANVDIPIIIGTQTSTLSMTLNPLVTAYNYSQISAVSTSIALTSYETFNRLIATDLTQARGIIELCIQFNWHNIGVLYEMSNYGMYFFSELTKYATIYNISIREFSYHDQTLMDAAIQLMINSNVLINLLLIGNVNDLEYIIDILYEHNRWTYPFYYIGVDSWMNGNAINIKNYSFNGYIGTCPWNPVHSVQYDDFSILWKELYYNTSIVEFYETNNDIPGLYSSYSYDLVYLIALAVEKYIDTDDGYNFDAIKLQNIMRNLSFVGITGNVSLNKNGDRENGLFGICNVANNEFNTIKSVGYFYFSNDYNNFTFYLDTDNVSFPTNFTDKGIQPQSTEIIIPVWVTIYRPAFWIFSVIISGLSFLLCVIYMILLYKFKNRSIIKAMSWKLILIMCCGVLLAYIAAFLYGIDEYYIYNDAQEWEFLCNFRLSILHFSITLGFVPLFVKTYRISKIFNTKSLRVYIIKDKRLFIVIGILLAIDVLLLSILYIVGRLHRIYLVSTMDESNNEKYLENAGFEYMNDPLYAAQLQFGSCEHMHRYGFYIHMIMLVIKMLMFVYGLYLAISIIRVPGKKFNDSFEIVVSVLIASSLMIIVVPLEIFVPVTTIFGINFRYCAIVGSILIATNIGIASLVLPRFIAIFKNKEDEYTKSDAQTTKELKTKYRLEITQQFHRLQMSIPSVLVDGSQKAIPMTNIDSTYSSGQQLQPVPYSEIQITNRIQQIDEITTQTTDINAGDGNSELVEYDNGINRQLYGNNYSAIKEEENSD
eukprot:253021_1